MIEQESLRHITFGFDLNWETQGWIWHWSTSNCFLWVHLRPFICLHKIVNSD